MWPRLFVMNRFLEGGVKKPIRRIPCSHCHALLEFGSRPANARRKKPSINSPAAATGRLQAGLDLRFGKSHVLSRGTAYNIAYNLCSHGLPVAIFSCVRAGSAVSDYILRGVREAGIVRQLRTESNRLSRIPSRRTSPGRDLDPRSMRVAGLRKWNHAPGCR
jgi:hypothetical protein